MLQSVSQDAPSSAQVLSVDGVSSMVLDDSIVSSERLGDLLQEADSELSKIQPEIEALERAVQQLKDLKQSKQKLLSLKFSLQSIIDGFSQERITKNSEGEALAHLEVPIAKLSSGQIEALDQATFYPEQAFEAADTVLKQKQSTNYELFRAIALNGGKAGTETIKQYLIEHRIQQPASGEGFEEVPLSEISARVNYLVRKGLVTPNGKGLFIATVGWDFSS